MKFTGGGGFLRVVKGEVISPQEVHCVTPALPQGVSMALCVVEISLDGKSFTTSRNVCVYNIPPEVESVSSKCMSTSGGNSVIVKGKGIINTGRTSLRVLGCTVGGDLVSPSSSPPWTEYVSVIINARWDIMRAISQCYDVLQGVGAKASVWAAIEKAQG